jgi:hypothetical protein
MKIVFDHLHGYVKDNKIFCEAFAIPEEETEEQLLELGFLPNYQPSIYWYQSQSCRINSEKVILSHNREKLLSQFEIEVIPYSENKKEVDLFYEDYFIRKGFDIIDYYISNSSYDDLKVMKVKLGNVVVAYTRFREFENVLLALEISFINI